MAEQASTGETVQERTGAVLDETRARAGETVRRVAKESGSFVDNQKRLAAIEVDGYACALHETAKVLRDQDQGMAGDYADKAGDALDRFAHMLRERDLGGMVDDFSDFARRNPAVFIVGAVAAGFLTARFTKGSQSDVSMGTEKTSEIPAGEQRSAKEAHTEESKSTGEPYTSADIEVPVILKPHEPVHHPEEHKP